MSDIDGIDTVIGVACDVLRDYAGEPGTTRIERLARWVLANIGGEHFGLRTDDNPNHFTIGLHTPDGNFVDVFLSGDEVAVDVGGRFAPAYLRTDQARSLAMACLRVAEVAES